MNKKILGYSSFLLIILFNLFLHAYLASHTRFISDDYCSAAMAERLGVFRASWYWYLNWSGRYSASTLDSIFGLLGPNTTAIAIPIILSIWLSILAFTIYSLVPKNENKTWYAVLLGANILFLTFLLSPNIRQSVYWGQGMRSVLPPMILFTLYVGWFRWYQLKDTNEKVPLFWLLIIFLYIFGIGGFSETFAVLQAIILLIALVCNLKFRYSYNWKSTSAQILALAVAGAALALFVIVMAPGNIYRQAQLPPAPDAMEILIISVSGFIDFLHNLLGSIDKTLGLFGVMGIGLFIGYQFQHQVASKYTLLLIPLMTFFLMYICFPPAAYGLSDAPPARTLIIPVYIISVGVVAFGFILGNQFKRHSINARLIQGLSLVAMIMFLVSNYLIDVNLIKSRGTFIEFAVRWENNHSQILSDKKAKKNQSIVATMDDVNWAGATNIHGRQKFWLNQCVSQYYGIETIAVDKPVSSQDRTK